MMLRLNMADPHLMPRIAAVVAIALTTSMSFFQLMLYQVLAGSQGGIRRPVRC
jgi:hypothetical protein